MFYSEELINAYVPQTVVVEYTTYGQRILELFVAGVYEIKCVGAGGLSMGCYCGDAGGGFAATQVGCGGCGGYISTEAFLKPDRYTIVVGCYGGGTDVGGARYSGVKTGGQTGSIQTSTYLQNSNGDVLISAGGGSGYAGYSGAGVQKNDGGRYVLAGTAYGGSCSLNTSLLNPVWNTVNTTGLNGYTSAGDVPATCSRTGTYITGGVEYGKPHTIHGGNGGYYNITYDVYSGTGGYFRLKYLRSNA